MSPKQLTIAILTKNLGRLNNAQCTIHNAQFIFLIFNFQFSICMEDFIEIIFYVVILALSGIGSLLKNKKKQQQPKSQSSTTVFTENQNSPNGETPHNVFDDVKEQTEIHSTQESDVEENELVRMLREAAAAAEAQQREKEALEQQQKALQKEQARRKAEEENMRKAELIRAQRAAERAKQQVESEKMESEVVEDENTSVFGLNLSDVDEARRAFVASEIFNKKYC